MPSKGTYFRLVKNKPPRSEDFVSVYYGKRAYAENLIATGRRSQCQTMGLSVFEVLADAEQCARWMPKLGSRVAAVIASPSDGKMLATRGQFVSHRTW